MTKKKIDLSNPGGHPKDWLDRAKEPSELGLKGHALLWATGALLLLTIGALAWGALRILF